MTSVNPPNPIDGQTTEELVYKRKIPKYEKVFMPLVGVILATIVLLAVCLHLTEVMGVDIPYMSLGVIQNSLFAVTVVMVLFVAVLIFSKNHGYAN